MKLIAILVMCFLITTEAAFSNTNSFQDMKQEVTIKIAEFLGWCDRPVPVSAQGRKVTYWTRNAEGECIKNVMEDEDAKEHSKNNSAGKTR